jgi:hypothetical protein
MELGINDFRIRDQVVLFSAASFGIVSFFFCSRLTNIAIINTIQTQYVNYIIRFLQ